MSSPPDAVCVMMDSDGVDVPDPVTQLLKGLEDGVDIFCIIRDEVHKDTSEAAEMETPRSLARA